MSTLGERLKQAREHRGLTQQEVAESAGMSQPTYFKIESGKTKRTTYLNDLARALAVSADWLATGQGSMSVTIEQNLTPVTEWDDSTPLDDDEVEIPFYKDIAFACGHGAINGDAPLEGRKLRMGKRTLSSLGVMPINAYAVTARDDSMTPHIQDGDTIYIDKGRKEVKDGRIFAIRFGELCLCKRLYRLPDGGVRIVSDNAAEFPEQVATKQQISDGEFEVIGWVWSVSRLERW